MPAWIELPIPTPPPWWTLTQCAPAAVLRSAFRIGQSAIASEPSASPRSRGTGDATEPASRWSRPITIGAGQLARCDQLVDREPGLRAVAVAEPADPRRQPLERDALRGQLEPALQERVVGEQLRRPRGRSPRCPPGRPRAPPSGTARCPRRRAAGCTPGRSPGMRTPLVRRARLARPPLAGCCHSRTRPRPRRSELDHRLDVRRPSTRTRDAEVLVGIARAQRRGFLERQPGRARNR